MEDGAAMIDMIFTSTCKLSSMTADLLQSQQRCYDSEWRRDDVTVVALNLPVRQGPPGSDESFSGPLALQNRETQFSM